VRAVVVVDDDDDLTQRSRQLTTTVDDIGKLLQQLMKLPAASVIALHLRPSNRTIDWKERYIPLLFGCSETAMKYCLRWFKFDDIGKQF
jgi:hypothetical protein